METMLSKCFDSEQKAMVALLWITGARPAELLELVEDSFIDRGEDMLIEIPTKKHGYLRTLPISKQTPFMEYVLNYLKDPKRFSQQSHSTEFFLDGVPQRRRIFHWRSVGCVRAVVERVSLFRFCPYTFRHNRITQLAMSGASGFELMVWKGAKDMRSVAPYIARSTSLIEGLKGKIK